MPRFADLQERFDAPETFTEYQTSSEEIMVCDARSHLSPVQMVEQKLGAALHRKAVTALRDPNGIGRKSTKLSSARPTKPR